MNVPPRLPSGFLGATKRYEEMSVSVTSIELDNAVSAGVQLRAFGREMVPLYEEHTARLESGTNLREWEAMDEMEKAIVIAQRRIRMALENLQADAQIKAAKRQAGRVKR